MGKLCKPSTGDDDVCHMHRRRRMGKGEKLKSRIHQRKPRTRRSPVLVTWIHYHSLQAVFVGLWNHEIEVCCVEGCCHCRQQGP